VQKGKVVLGQTKAKLKSKKYRVPKKRKQQENLTQRKATLKTKMKMNIKIQFN